MTMVLIALLWAAYCALHSFLISITVTELVSRIGTRYYAFYRLFYVVISFVLLVPLIRYTTAMEGPDIVPGGEVLSIIRFVLTWGAVLIFSWTFLFEYDPLSFFGIRQIMLMVTPRDAAAPPELRKNGLLGIVRHPMYFALFVFLWAGTHSLANIVVNIVLSVYIVIGTRLEERKLVLEFGEAYVRYQREVPMLLPFGRMRTAS